MLDLSGDEGKKGAVLENWIIVKITRYGVWKYLRKNHSLGMKRKIIYAVKKLHHLFRSESTV